MIANETREKLSQLTGVSVCQILDANPSLSVEEGIRPLAPPFRVCAPAFTVRCHPDDNLTLHHALSLAEPGYALVVSGSGGRSAAFWGEIMSISARSRGLLGTLIDGPARDPIEISELNYPVFARSICPRKAAKIQYGSIRQTIQWGKLTINHGDIVVGDCNGVLAFPTSQLAQVLDRSLAVARKEAELKETMRLGKTFFEIASLSSLVPTRRD